MKSEKYKIDMVVLLIKDGTFPYQLFVGLKNISNVFILNATMMSIKVFLEIPFIEALN